MEQLTPVRPEQERKDRTTRSAALWATSIALPVTVLVAILGFVALRPDTPADEPSPSPTTPRAQSSAPVEMAAPPLAERATLVCRALLAKLPATVRDLTQRPVTAGAEQNAAYGDPALTVACGATLPSYHPEEKLWVVNAVCWHAKEGKENTDPTVLTTVDREVPVQVTVPSAYEAPLQWIPSLSEALVSSVPTAKDVPFGCTG